MSTYKWIKMEWTCDQCATKEMMGDRSDDIPVGWFTIDNMSRQTQGCRSSKPGNHFCSKECFTKYINSYT